MPSIPLEICINAGHAQQAAQAAFKGGADRIELCSRMDVGGLTPSVEAISLARQAFSKPGLMVMIRPSAGDFVYSSSEQTQMLASIRNAKAAGADGVVLGAIKDEKVDLELTKTLVQEARALDLSVTFHRAFDAVLDRETALEQLITLGVSRVLTSGTAWDSHLPASEGLEVLKTLAQQAAGRIELVIGGGVNQANLNTILAELGNFPNISVHSYSGAQENGQTTEKAVNTLHQLLVKAAQEASPANL